MTAAPNRPQTNESSHQTAITPELVRQVTEKVYALWLKESEIERERHRVQPKRDKR